MHPSKHRAIKIVFSVLLAAVLVFGQASVAFASGDRQTECQDNGGSWVGSDANTGTCTYPEGNAVTLSVCGAGYILTRSYTAFSLDSETCTAVAVDDGPSYFYGECSDRQEGAATGPINLAPCNGYNGSATFGEGACATECTVGAGLPSVANRNLPDDALATLYVRVVGEDGQPSNDSYTACFDNPEGISLTLYRFVSGEWRALVTSSGDPICAGASGDGSFYIAPAS